MQSFLLPNSDKTKMIKSKNWQKDFCWQLLYSFFGSAYQRYHKDLKMSFLVLAVSDNNSCFCFIRIDYSNFLFLRYIKSSKHKTLWFDPISTIWNLTWINSNLNRSEGGFDDVQNSKRGKSGPSSFWNSLTMLLIQWEAWALSYSYCDLKRNQQIPGQFPVMAPQTSASMTLFRP